MWGSNARDAHPIFFHHVLKGIRNGAKMYAVDPRRSSTAKWADAWVGIHVGSDISLANAVANEIIQAGLVHEEFIRRATVNFEEYKEVKEIENAKAFVHCDSGQSISPSLVMAYMLIASHKQGKRLPLAAALKRIQGLDPSAVPNDNFMNQLIDLEDELYGEISVKSVGRRGKSGGTGQRRRGGGTGKPGARDLGTGAAAKARMKYQRGKGKRGK